MTDGLDAAAQPAPPPPRAYTAEIDSDCTAETAFPYVTGPLSVSAAPITRGDPIAVTVPNDPSTFEVTVQLRSAAGDGSGTYAIHVRLLDTALEHEASYALDPGFSATTYALTKVNHAVAPAATSTVPTSLPAAVVTLE